MKKFLSVVVIAASLAFAGLAAAPTSGSLVNPKQAAACGLQGQQSGSKQVYSYVDQRYHWLNYNLAVYWDCSATYTVNSTLNTTDGTNLYGGIAAIRVWLSTGSYYGGASGCNAINTSSSCRETFYVYTGYGISTDNYNTGTFSSNFSPNPATYYLKQNARI